MDKEMKEYLGGLKEEIKKLRESFNEKTDELKRHTSAVYEEFQKRIELVVEGHEVLDRKIDELKEEITFELKEVRATMKALYKDMEHRVKVLERAKH
ncbi:MAG: hypothetical protein HY808_03805 [Nitrospirae bacterium]|nr:hypothetical protein [Nitrospirota bacterium]